MSTATALGVGGPPRGSRAAPGGPQDKRKSAVELLAESKPLYVKSDKLRLQQGQYILVSPSHSLPPQRQTRRTQNSNQFSNNSNHNTNYNTSDILQTRSHNTTSHNNTNYNTTSHNNTNYNTSGDILQSRSHNTCYNNTSGDILQTRNHNTSHNTNYNTSGDILQARSHNTSYNNTSGNTSHNNTNYNTTSDILQSRNHNISHHNTTSDILQSRNHNTTYNNTSGDILQNRLRQLLVCADAKENSTIGSVLGYTGNNGKLNEIQARGDDYKSLREIGQHYSEFSTNYNHQQSQRYLNLSQNDFFPNSFLSPQSTQNTFTNTSQLLYQIDHLETTTEKHSDNLNLTDDYRAISPPAEYAVTERSTYKYVRSYSHSQPIQQNTPNYYNSTHTNINSHKSLPDLYTQTDFEHSTEDLSSKGTKSCSNKSNKSSDIFIKSSRSNSSFNRDSGGSSGHYTHRSEPIRKNIDYRRDSGSSTQHSDNSYEMYSKRFPNIIETQIVENCVECQALYHCGDDFMYCETPAVPEQFQDGYEDKIKYSSNSYMSHDEYTQASIYMDGCKYKITNGGYMKDCNYRIRDSGSSSLPVDPELSPPLGQFKRQKCFRYKNRKNDDRKPVLRSKSDVSDNRYKTRIKTHKKNTENETLERFFDQLGLNDETYDELLTDNERLFKNKSDKCDSPVFFSDVSTIDSNRAFEYTDFTNSGPQNGVKGPQTGVFRSNEAPSIVERNARIIKWLCNCRKMQMTAEK